MSRKIVHILGAGQLVFRLKKNLNQHGYEVIQCNDDKINNISVTGSIIDNLENYFKGFDLSKVVMIYLLDDLDENNLQLIVALTSLKLNIPITASLFNENFISKLFKETNKLTIINPAKIAAPSFVNAVLHTSKVSKKYTSTHKKLDHRKKGDTLIVKLVLVFALLALLAIIYFHYMEKMSWINAVYFVIVTMATVGYGDINLVHSSALSKLIDVFLIIGSTVLMWTIFSLTIDYFLKNRIQLSLGRKKYNVKNHVIVCGLGRLGYFIVEELLQKGNKVIIIEINENSKHLDYFRNIGADVYIGDARSEKVLYDVNIHQCKALISVISNDAKNIEIGLQAKTIFPAVRLVLRIFDEDIALEIKKLFNIKYVLSNSAIASNYFFNILNNNTTDINPKDNPAAVE